MKAGKVHKNHQKFKTSHDLTEIMKSYAYCAHLYRSAEIPLSVVLISQLLSFLIIIFVFTVVQ